MAFLLAIPIFVIGYLLITFEHELKINKSAAALLMGGILWMIVPFFNDHFQEDLLHAGSDIFGIVAFLLAAMSLVEVLAHYGFFDLVRQQIFRWNLAERQQFIVICFMSFFLSAIIDNLTCTIVMTQIALRFFSGKNLLRAVAGVVIAANAGGAFSPIGDVTTIMLWLQGKFTATEILTRGFLPSFALLITSVGLMYRQLTPTGKDSVEELNVKVGRSERIIITAVLCSFMFPLLFSQINLPPYLGLLVGLGIVWFMVDIFKQLRPKPTHLEASIDEFIKKTDIPSLKFFIGILLAVAALESLGILEALSHYVYGTDESFTQIVIGNISLGFLSAVLDNVPLTALAMEMLHTNTVSLWVLLALSVGTGGSLLVVGSAAGVIAMGMVKELTFSNYLKIATVPALLGYLVAIGVWFIQGRIFGF